MSEWAVLTSAEINSLPIYSKLSLIAMSGDDTGVQLPGESLDDITIGKLETPNYADSLEWFLVDSPNASVSFQARDVESIERTSDDPNMWLIKIKPLG